MKEEEERITTGPPEVYFLHEIARRLADFCTPLSAVIWNNEEISPSATGIIDTHNYTSLTMYIEVDKPAKIILLAVSRDGKEWRRVGEEIGVFDEPGRRFTNLTEVVLTKEVLLYRYFKFRLDVATKTRITLEVMGKYEAPFEFMAPMPPVRMEVGLPSVPVYLTPLEKLLTKIHNDLATRISAIQGQLANADEWDHYHSTVTSAGTPVNLSVLEVPDGCQLVVKSMSDNTGAIYLGKSEAAVLTDTKRVTLPKKDHSTTFKVTNADLIWVDAEVDGEGVEYWSEKKK